MPNLLPRFQFKVTLDNIDPPIWRRLLVPRNASLRRVHTLVQKTMGWTDSHMHRFKQDGREIGKMDPHVQLYLEDESMFPMTHLWSLPGHLAGYEYDFDARWEHSILLEEIVPGESAPHGACCVDGARACPPENCGGIAGYQHLLDALWNPAHPEHQALRRWVGEGFDSERFDLKAVNRAISGSVR